MVLMPGGEDVPYYFGSIIRAIAHFLREGLNLAQAIFSLGRAYRGFPEEVYQSAGKHAQEIYLLSKRFEALGEGDPLQEILGNVQAPGPQTYINFRVGFAHPEDAENRELWTFRTVQWRGPWGTTRGQIRDDIMEIIKEMLKDEYDLGEPGMEVQETDLASLIWFQHPEQL
jgi:hypothetical protein